MDLSVGIETPRSSRTLQALLDSGAERSFVSQSCLVPIVLLWQGQQGPKAFYLSGK